MVAALCNAQRARGCAVRSTGQRRKPARAQRNLHSAPSYAEARRGGARGGCDCRGDPCRTTPPMNIECGVDEAGRGPLAGPVVAAAVILDETAPIHGLADSKTLSAQKRAALFELICARARAYCIASASVEEIDRLNILNATLLAMRRAVETLAIRPTLAQIDGNRCPPLNIRAQAIVRGDAHIPAISAASILAKVARDRMLLELHAQYPEYGFDRHAGYGTRAHLAALQRYGPCVHHRRSFAPVRALLKHSHLV
ncbi:ribonuclease HII [Candidatus Glomeribacter gigasporarum]